MYLLEIDNAYNNIGETYSSVCFIESPATAALVATRDDAPFLALCREAQSPEAIELVTRVVTEICKGLGPKPQRKKLSPSVGALVSALLKTAANNPDDYSFRPLGAGDFTGLPVSYRSFTQSYQGMQAQGYIDVTRGYCPASLSDPKPRAATRMRLTPAFLALAARYGIDPANWHAHFRNFPRPAKIADPIVKKASSTRDKWGRKIGGERLKVDMKSPSVMELAQQVNDINAFIAGQDLGSADHYAFQRIFNQGDEAGYNWNKGGRLYSIGGGYQAMKQAERKGIKINGEPTVEIDIRASHLTILHALMKVPFDPSRDPYSIPDIPRSIVKSWVTMTLGNDKFQTRWSDGAKERFQKEFGGQLQADFPLPVTRGTILKHLPIFSSWEGCPWRWGDLQYLESCAVIDAVHRLATEYAIPALPVHDSLIVPVSHREVAEEVLKENFKRHIGAVPVLNVK